MALYDPIRDGFREFNNLLLDAKQWDERNAAAEADRAYRHSVLESNLVQREFENQMTQKRFILAQSGDVRAERQLNATIADQKARLEIANKQLGISQANQKINAEELTLKKAKHVQDMRIVTAQANNLSRPYEPVDVDLNGLVPERNSTDPAYMGELNEITGQFGAFVDTDLLPKTLNADGSSTVVQLSPVDQQKFVPIVMGLNAKYTDPNGALKSRVTILDDQRVEQTKLANASGENYNQKERAFARREVNRLEGEINNEMAGFKNENVSETELRRATEMSALAAWQRNANMLDQADATDRMAQASYERAIAAKKASKGETIQTWKRELDKDGNSVPTGKFVWDSVDYNYSRKDKDGNVVVTTDLADLGLTADEPRALTAAERGVGGGGEKGLLTEAQMVRVKDFYEAEGMTAVFASDAVKPKLAGMRTIIARVHKNLGGGAENRLLAKTESIQKIEELESAYWDEVDQIPLKTKDKKKILRQLGVAPIKGRTRKQQIEDHLYDRFAIAIRQIVGDDKMRVYRPNKTTRQMTRGLTR